MIIPDTLAKLVHGLMAEWKDHQVIANNDGKHRGTPEGTWVSVSGLRFSAFIFYMGQRLIKVVYERKLNNVKKRFNVLKNTSVTFMSFQCEF